MSIAYAMMEFNQVVAQVNGEQQSLEQQIAKKVATQKPDVYYGDNKFYILRNVKFTMSRLGKEREYRNILLWTYKNKIIHQADKFYFVHKSTLDLSDFCHRCIRIMDKSQDGQQVFQRFYSVFKIKPKTAKGIINRLNGKIYLDPLGVHQKLCRGRDGAFDVGRVNYLHLHLNDLQQADKDGIPHIVPISIGMGMTVKQAKDYYGKGFWKSLCKNSYSKNMYLYKIMQKFSRLHPTIINTRVDKSTSKIVSELRELNSLPMTMLKSINGNSIRYENEFTTKAIKMGITYYQELGVPLCKLMDRKEFRDAYRMKAGDIFHFYRGGVEIKEVEADDALSIGIHTRNSGYPISGGDMVASFKDQVGRHAQIANDTRRMASTLNLTFNPDWDIKKMDEKHDEYTKEINTRKDMASQLPYPILEQLGIKDYSYTAISYLNDKDGKGIIPYRYLVSFVKTPAELREVGNSQKHCVYSYTDSIAKGDYLVATIKEHETGVIKSTFSFRIGKRFNKLTAEHTRYECKEDQHYMACNKKPTKELVGIANKFYEGFGKFVEDKLNEIENETYTKSRIPA